ncbi:MAG: 30S ribosomal protein S9 [Candidatus Nomurabacteria bacterium]|jgi:small subunit ribosomal protein S9|nr:30S ribosomal protein S9 [Candidatus Nomurabacteria bacterium]
MADKAYFYGLGRRKAATARARLYKGKGQITINGQAVAAYLDDNKTLAAELTDPLALVEKQNDFDITLLIQGGGVSGQVDAAKLAISKALVESDQSLRDPLKKAGFLKRDSRIVERKKYGLKGARKREQFSKR